MRYPFMITSCGHTFERDAIRLHLSRKQQCAICREPATVNQLMENYALRNTIEEYNRGRQS